MQSVAVENRENILGFVIYSYLKNRAFLNQGLLVFQYATARKDPKGGDELMLPRSSPPTKVKAKRKGPLKSEPQKLSHH